MLNNGFELFWLPQPDPLNSKGDPMRRIPNWTCQLEPNSSATSTAERHRLRPFFVIAFCVLQRGHPNNGTTEDILQTATVELQKKLNLPRILQQDGKGQEEQGGTYPAVLFQMRETVLHYIYFLLDYISLCNCIYIIYNRRKFRSQTSDNMDR